MNKNLFSKVEDKKSFICLKSILIGVGVTVVAMLVFAAAMLFLEVDRGLAKPFATVSVALGSLFASMYAAKKIGDRGYLIGALVGLAVFAVITIIALILNEGNFTNNTIFHFVIIVLASIIGGIVGVNKDKSKKYI